MGAENTGQDVLRMYLTGAPSDGGAQVAHSASMGGFRSSTQFQGLGHKVSQLIPNITLDHVADANGEGIGTITAIDENTLAWTPPGGTQGTGVAVANGETKVLEGGTDSKKYVRVSRTSTDDLAGQTSVTLEICENTAVSMDNVTGPEATASEASYRALMIHNVSSGEASSVKVWVETDAETRFEFGIQTPIDSELADYSAHGDTFDVPDPTSWNTDSSYDSPFDAGSIAAGESLGLWIKRDTESSAPCDPSITVKIGLAATVGGTEYRWELSGQYAVANEDTAEYRLYHGIDADPDFSAAPWETFASLPHTTAALTVSHVHNLVLREMNEYGVESQNLEAWRVELDAAGNIVYESPSTPTNISVTAKEALSVLVEAVYDYASDGEDDKEADTWLIYYTTDGSNPDPDNDTPAEETMIKASGEAYLEWTLDEGLSEGDVVKVLVRTQRSAEDVESSNTTIYSATATAVGVAGLVERASVSIVGPETEYIDEVIWGSGDDRIDRVRGSNVHRLYLGGALVAAWTASGILMLKGDVLTLPYSSNETQDEYLEIDGETGALGLAVLDGETKTRVADIDTDGNLTVNEWTEDPGFPEAGTYTDEIEWNSDGSTLDFSPDLAKCAVRVDWTDAAVNLGEIICRIIHPGFLG